MLVTLQGVDRPQLAAALDARGLVLGEGEADVLLARPSAPRIAALVPILLEVDSVEEAAAELDGGADDVVLATDADLLVAARLAALVRRGRPGMLKVGDLTIDAVEQRVSRAGRPIVLLPREYALLIILARNAGTTVSRTRLREAVWGPRIDPGTNVIAVHLSRIRRRLGPGGPLIVTERGCGYRMIVPMPVPPVPPSPPRPKFPHDAG